MFTPDELDLRIISRLQDSDTCSPAAIAAELGTSASTVRRRIHGLCNDNVIRMQWVADPSRIGLNIGAIIAVHVALDCLHSAAQALLSRKEVTWVTLTAGRYDLLFAARFKNNAELVDFQANTLGSIDGVRDTETFFILEAYRKHRYDTLTQDKDHHTEVAGGNG